MPAYTLSGSNSYKYLNGKLIEKPSKASRVSEKNDTYECFDQRLKIVDEHTLDMFEKKRAKTNKKAENQTYTLNKSKVRKKIASFFMLKASRGFAAFFTISFPCQISDKIGYQVFNTWLTRCRKECGLKTYIWIAERQKNGTLHFHMLTNNRMHIRVVNAFMYKALETQIINGNLNYPLSEIERYNGVDVDNLYYSKNRKNHKKAFTKEEAQRKLGRYVTKYVTKNDTKMDRLAWHCSRDVSALFTSQFFNEDEFFLFREAIYNEMIFKKIERDSFISIYIPKFKDNLADCTILEKVNNEVFKVFHEKLSQKIWKPDKLAV